MTQLLQAHLPEAANSADGRNSGQETEYLLKLVASLEACNMALLNKFNQAERELAVLRQSSEISLPGTEQAGHHNQTFGWERKLTRTQWRQPT